ncbi:MAG: DUF72 domain-containing protein [Actinomycetota bacterium]|nr:DUF72 domain-containing protein [Actinomycetota bacterium]
MADLRIGISGWTYAGWRRSFYPPGLPQARELAYAASQVNSIEINGSFYSLQRPSSYRAWRDATPANFVFAVKGPRFVTHMKKLVDVQTPVANFFASGVLALGPKLGPILWQLPPMLGFSADRLARFFDLLPRSTAAAARVAEHHDDRLRDRTWTTTDADRPLRYALEVRHASYQTPAFVELLRAYDVALVTADTAGKWPFLEDQTSDFAYARLHGDQELYVSGYSEAALDAWADKVRAWHAGRDPAGARLAGPAAPPLPAGRPVFVYFDNDVKVRAPYDAMTLAHKLRGIHPAG